MKHIWTRMGRYLENMRKKWQPKTGGVTVFGREYRAEIYPMITILFPDDRYGFSPVFCIVPSLLRISEPPLLPYFPSSDLVIKLPVGIMAFNTDPNTTDWDIPRNIALPHEMTKMKDNWPTQHLLLWPDKKGKGKRSGMIHVKWGGWPPDEKKENPSPVPPPERKKPAKPAPAITKPNAPDPKNTEKHFKAFNARKTFGTKNGRTSPLTRKIFGFTYRQVVYPELTVFEPAEVYAVDPPDFLIVDGFSARIEDCLPEHLPGKQWSQYLPEGIIAIHKAVPDEFDHQQLAEMTKIWDTRLSVIPLSVKGIRPSIQRIDVKWSLRENRPYEKPVRNTSTNASIVQLDWEILPPGYNPRNDSFLKPAKTKKQQKKRELLMERLDFLTKLHPTCWYRGIEMKGGREYRVAEFANHVVAECPLLGNVALVVEKENWQEILSLTKAYAKQHSVTIFHKGNWKNRLLQALGRPVPACESTVSSAERIKKNE